MTNAPVKRPFRMPATQNGVSDFLHLHQILAPTISASMPGLKNGLEDLLQQQVRLLGQGDEERREDAHLENAVDRNRDRRGERR
jgi:hypothetical protein